MMGKYWLLSYEDLIAQKKKKRLMPFLLTNSGIFFVMVYLVLEIFQRWFKLEP